MASPTRIQPQHLRSTERELFGKKIITHNCPPQFMERRKALLEQASNLGITDIDYAVAEALVKGHFEFAKKLAARRKVA